ncbi:hypothetical protein B0T18DRAFT_419659 [Schizothecium vesticola]|uniref:NB-ARC domain-containing protein n=1 Tax=Schizothecium vesticola TaxID=314040 RepID=A0AA40EKU1_9PEZI|nr:hypothetical protein B0T18DRAFT_419659 [Schizothecium vesticola]
MGAHPDDTWCNKIDSDDGSVNVNWLIDQRFLPAAFPRSRISRYGYDSRWFGEDAIRTKTSDISQAFLFDLNEYRKKDQTRPLIFIGHSFGGLVILKMLVDAHMERKRWPGIYDSTVGLVFLGTPFRGTHGSLSQGEILIRAQELFTGSPVYGENLGILQAGGEPLTDLVDTYFRIARQSPMPRVACFYEQRASEVGRILGKDLAKATPAVILVDETSGSLDLGEKSDKYALPRTHFNIQKFGSPREQGFRLLASVIQTMVDEGPQLVSSRAKDHGPYRTTFTLQGVPVSNNFVDRPSDTAELERCLLPRSRKNHRRKLFVLYGLGGIGKTQLAIDFARRHQATFSSVFWLDGRSEDRLRQSLAGCASRIPKDQIPDKSRTSTLHSEDDLNVVVTDVLDWLAQPDNTDWLLVFDNVDQDHEQGGATGAYDIRRYLPGDHGSVLITTRLSRLTQLGDSKQLKKVDQELSKAIFEKWYGQDLVMDEASSELLGLLDGLPLALAQAASYLRDMKLSTVSYVQLYKQQWDELMKSNGESGSPLMDYDQRNIRTTWTISFKAIEAKSKNAADLLRLWAFIDNKDLWHGLLQTAAHKQKQWPWWLREMAYSEVRFMAAVRLLIQYSMIETGESVQGSFSMHPVVHRWASHIQDEAGKMEFLRLAVMVIGSSLPLHTSKDYWVLERRLLPHAERCSRWMGEMYGLGWGFNDPRNIDATLGFGHLYIRQGRLKEAETMFPHTLEGSEKVLGRDHMLTLDTVNSLGVLYMNQGRLKEAETMYQRALKGKENSLGRDHASTLATVTNLGILYMNQGRLKKAETMLGQALEGFENALGPDHTWTLEAVSGLGLLYRHQDRFQEAEAMYLRALEGKEKALGPDHTLTLDTVTNLGLLYKRQGRLQEAETMYRRALPGLQGALGPSHSKCQNVMRLIESLQLAKGSSTETDPPKLERPCQSLGEAVL